MEHYKQEFIDFLLESGALKFDEFTLKSGRKSPYFINTGDFNDGNSALRLGAAYASRLIDTGKDIDIVFGPAYKGIPLAVMTSMALAERGSNVGYAFDRKEAKTHGEGSNTAQQFVGKPITDGLRIALIDDVFVTGETKDASITQLNAAAKNLSYLCLVAVDRQELTKEGTHAIAEFTKRTGIDVYSIVTSTDIRTHLAAKPRFEARAEQIASHLRTYGTPEAREALR